MTTCIRLGLACAAVALPAGCSTKLRGPDLGGLYDREAQHHGAERNPVIVIPGILGSRLVDRESGRVVWGAFAGDYADPGRPDGARLVALPMREGVPLAQLGDEVSPDGALDRLRVSLLGLPLELDAYVNILGTLGVGGYRDEFLGKAGAVDYGGEHYTCFQFDYDWRRDVTETAQRLHEFILQKKAYVEAEHARRFGPGGRPVRFDIVAHSMGGLVARYYLLHGPAGLPDDGPIPAPGWEGARHVERVILVGTPGAGSVKALRQLVEGVSFAPFLPKYEAAVIGTMPAVYQLLPRPRHRRVVDASDRGRPVGDILDAALWERLGWGLASPDQDDVLEVLLPDVDDPAARRRIALDHLRKCLARARRLAEALDAPATRPDGLELYLFAGDAVPTDAILAVDSGSGRITVAGHEPGDGTVTRSSALLDERLAGSWTPGLMTPIAWTHVSFLFTDHLGMTRDPAFSDNVLYLLLEDPRQGVQQAR